MERKLSRTIIAASITLAMCLALGFGAVYLYRAYKISDIVSDESTQDNISRFMTGAYTGYCELSEEEKELFRDVYKAEDKLYPWTVATQVVAGINYRYVCTDDNGEEYVVTIYKPLPNQGEARVTGVAPCLARKNAQSYYDAYFNGLKADKPRKVTEFFSTDLKALWDKAYGVPDWDLYLLAQDWDEPSFEIVSVDGNSKEANVSVKVRNFGFEKINTLRMVHEGDCYLVDDFIADGYDVKELLTKQVGE